MSHSNALAVDAALRACARSTGVVHLELKRGLNSLATIASTAPLVGILATAFSIVPSVTCGGEKSTCMAAMTETLSEALAPTVFGLLIALIALWSYKYLNSELEAIDLEMKTASLDLANQLAHLARGGAGLQAFPTQY
jgi:biopolymer transport protein ExbB